MMLRIWPSLKTNKENDFIIAHNHPLLAAQYPVKQLTDRTRSDSIRGCQCA